MTYPILIKYFGMDEDDNIVIVTSQYSSEKKGHIYALRTGPLGGTLVDMSVDDQSEDDNTLVLKLSQGRASFHWMYVRRGDEDGRPQAMLFYQGRGCLLQELDQYFYVIGDDQVTERPLSSYERAHKAALDVLRAIRETHSEDEVAHLLLLNLSKAGIAVPRRPKGPRNPRGVGRTALKAQTG